MKRLNYFFALVVAVVTAFSAQAVNTSTCVLVGDVDGDGSVTAADVTALYSFMLSGDESAIVNGDVDDDGSITAGDVTKVYSILLGIDPEAMKFTVNGVSFKMIKVTAGTFMMGASDNDTEAYDNERPAHQVTLTQDYWIGETEVTEGLWIAVMDVIPPFSIDDNYPVRRYSNAACKEFANALSQITGKNFALPTEAQWEFAARGGNNSHGYLYAGSNNIDEVAWYADNSSHGSYDVHEVAKKAPNELGLYDMCGNVAEWVSDDTYNYTAEPQVDPTHPQVSTNNVCRDGCWIDVPRDCRVTFRTLTSGSSVWIGFRLAIQP